MQGGPVKNMKYMIKEMAYITQKNGRRQHERKENMTAPFGYPSLGHGPTYFHGIFILTYM
jgi:hypothetical protein